MPSPKHSARTLRKLFPEHAVTPFAYVNILGFPRAVIQPVSPPDVITNNFFVPIATRMGKSTGIIASQVRFGSFHVAWDVGALTTMRSDAIIILVPFIEI